VLRQFRSKKINNGDSGTGAAACNDPPADWSVSHYIVARKKSAVCDAAFRQNSLTICCYYY